MPLPGRSMSVLPSTAPFDSRAEAPQPDGPGRAAPFARGRARAPSSPTSGRSSAGDRLRRINWRVSLRSDALHVVTTRAEQDTGVLLVVDALADHGRSGGIDGPASSLDVTVRAAAAVAEHHVRAGDRVSLRVIGAGPGVRRVRRRAPAPAA